MTTTEFSGMRALVTGAAGGIGRAICLALNARGASLVVADLDDERLAGLCSELEGATAVRADVATSEGADACLAVGGSLDVLINNAGVSDGLASVDELSDADWDRVLRVNLTAAFLLSSRAARQMIQDGRDGQILNVASVAGIRGGRAGAAYTASKWGLIGLTQNIAATLGDQGIRCNAIAPGGTTMAVSLGSVPLTPSGERRRTRDRDRPAPGTPESVADIVAWLIGPQAARLNGVVIPIDDGWTAY